MDETEELAEIFKALSDPTRLRLFRGERRGSFVHYSLDQDRLERYKAQLQDTLGERFVAVK